MCAIPQSIHDPASMVQPGARPTGARSVIWPILWFMPIAALSAYIVAVYLFESPPVPLIGPDTESYWYALHDHYIYSALYMHIFALRPLGYPAVLHAVYALAGNLQYIPALQSGAYCLAVLALQLAIWRLTRNIAVATIIAVVLLLRHALLYYSLWALSEQLFIAFLVLHVAAAAWALASRSRVALISMALTAVAIISLRPAGAFVLVAVPLFCLCWRGNRVFALRWAVLPLAIGMATLMGVGLAVRGIAIDQPGGWAAFPYVAYLYDGSGDVPLIAKQTIKANLLPYIRGHEAAERQGIFAVAGYEANHFNDIMYGLFAQLSKVLPQQDISALEGRLAMETIERHPGGYARLVFINLVGGLRFALAGIPLYPADIRNYYRQMIEPALVLGKMIGGFGMFDVDTDGASYGLVRDYPLPQMTHASISVRVVLLILFGIVVLVSVFGAVFQHPSNLAFFTAYTSILVIGGYLFVAMTTVFISRYAEPLDAFIIVTIASGMLEASRVLRRRFQALAKLQPQTDNKISAAHVKI